VHWTVAQKEIILPILSKCIRSEDMVFIYIYCFKIELHCFQNICSELLRDCFPFYTKFSLDNDEKIQSEKANNGQVKAIKITEI
jgi:hypothetical protein